jgi:ParB/RepB/Spo0J family partition protein
MVGLSGIAVPPDRLRQFRPELAAELAESIKVQGLLHPIVLRPRARNGIGYLLVAGRHRLEAVRLLGQQSIRAEIHEDMKADEAEIVEIDENLVRADLTPAETALHICRRKCLYLKQHPETARSVAGGIAKARRACQSNSATGTPAFVEVTAKKLGIDRSTVSYNAQRGAKLESILPVIIGTCLDRSEELAALVKLPSKDQHSLAKAAQNGEKVSAKTRLKQILRETKERELGSQQVALPDEKYGVVYADPPWCFEPYSRETGMDRAADNHYPTQPLEEIKTLLIPAADDCILFLWAIVPMLPEALEVMAAWKFHYKSHFVWLKDKVGTGYWNRNKHELLLIGTRGNIPAPAPGQQYDSVINASVGKHSAKPFAFREMIDEFYPTLPKLELYAREQFAGWDVWGNET